MTVEQESHRCSNCQATSDQVVLLGCERDGKAGWVCVRCLPMLIHGAH